MRTLQALQLLDKEFSKTDSSAGLYITGGFVRDYLRRKPNKDIDVVMKKISLKTAQSFLNKYGKTTKVSINHVPELDPVKCVLFRAYDDDMEAQLTTLKASKGVKVDLKQDSKQRDFTINAMYMPVNSIGNKYIIDFWGGRNDIESRQILSVGSAKVKFNQSPIRILRAFSLASSTKYTITQHVREAIKECAVLLKKIPVEAIRIELEKILLCYKPSKYLKLMQKLGVLKVILPELDHAVYCTQDKKYHKYNVFDHLVYTCDNIEPNLVLRLAGLFHDIGKPVVRSEVHGKITFYKHEVVGAKITGMILKRLRFDNKTIAEVTHLVRMHMYHYTKEYTDAGIRRFINNAGITEKDISNIGEFPLFKLRRAERLGNGRKKLPVTPRQIDFEKRIVEIYNNSSGLTLTDLAIDGNDIMNVFNIKPSKEIGIILRYLLNIIIENPEDNNRNTLLHYTLDFIESKKDMDDDTK